MYLLLDPESFVPWENTAASLYLILQISKGRVKKGDATNFYLQYRDILRPLESRNVYAKNVQTYLR